MDDEGAAGRVEARASEAEASGLVAINIGKSYHRRQVVRGVSLGLRRGEVVGLLGPNGAGKTTCFYMMTGLIRVDYGTILIDGQDVTALPMFQRARLGVGYLPQEASIFRDMTVEENVMSIVELSEPNKHACEEAVDGLLRELHIERLRKEAAVSLSGGERRRVEIARALATRPSFMLLDEPFAGVDPLAVHDIHELITFLKNRGIGILITDHNVRETLEIVDRAAILVDGQVLFEGEPEQVLANEAVRRVYLGEKFNEAHTMALSPRLEVRQSQGLVMTPQLQQAIKLLQLSAVELAEYVEGELERNPLLERAEGEPADPVEQPQARESSDAEAEPVSGTQFEAEAASESAAEEMSAGEREEAGVAPQTDWKTSTGKGGEDLPELEDSLSSDLTLAQHLDAQLAAAGVTAVERMIGAALIDQVDDWGYFRGDARDLSFTLGCDEAEVERMLRRMQGFEPVGVMARNLAECLTLQLKDRGRYDPAMEALIANLDMLARNERGRLEAVCGVDREDLDEMIAEVRALTPKPGAGFGAGPVQIVVPDIYVKAGPDGVWRVELNSDTLPRLLMNARYYGEVSASAKRDADKAFLSECAANASWLIKTLDQRARTILKVAREIVRQQDAFLAHGVEHLRPLNLKTVASAIEMHESTVSRVTANKYMSTPRGVFELKYFFTASIPAAGGGEGHSAEAVRHRIRHLIEAETSEEILSDDRIVEILRGAGIEIARRTVAKYRESLRIPSSVERKRRFGVGA